MMDLSHLAVHTNFARQALATFGLAQAELTFLSYTNNTLFKVQERNAHYVLRIHRPGLKQLAWIRSELMWLRALREGSSLIVPSPAADVYTGEMDGIDIPVHAVLFDWIEGESIPADALQLEQVEEIGRFAAALHDFSASFNPPPDFVRPHLNFDGLFGHNSPYYAGESGEQLIRECGGMIIDAVTSQVKAVMDKLDLDAESYGIIHADLLPKNLLWHEAKPGAVDFDDCAFGYFLYDLAPVLLGFKARPNYEAIRDVLWTGYTGARTHQNAAVTVTDLEALIAGRYVASIRWVAGNTEHPAIKGRAPQIIRERIAQLEEFLNTGTLELV